MEKIRFLGILIKIGCLSIVKIEFTFLKFFAVRVYRKFRKKININLHLNVP